jgi:hypothetical protein
MARTKSRVKHPKITPMRALNLLCRLHETYPKMFFEQGSGGRQVVDEVRDALASHVRAAISKVRA